jgi:Zn-dependent protease
MRSSYRLFSIRDIAIRMHITFPLILIWAAIQFGVTASNPIAGAAFGIVVILFLFAIVTAHELGHSFAALRYDVPVKDIILLPIGGVASLEKIPEKPREELVVAIAGPAVNFVLAIILGIVAVAGNLAITGPTSIITDLERITVEGVFSYIFIYNLFLGIFNLLPAFPMDGGRVLRALLATNMPYKNATSIAATVGKGMALLFGLIGFLGGGLFLILLAFFVYIGAGQEEKMVRTRTGLRGVTVDQAYSRGIETLSPSNTLRDAVNLTLTSTQASFPVCQDEQLVGLLSYPALARALQDHDPDATIDQVMVQNVPQITPDDDLFEAQQRLNRPMQLLDALPVDRKSVV